MFRLSILFVASGLILTCACSSKDDTSQSASQPGTQGTCAGEASHGHADLADYRGGISKTGDQGITVMILDSSPVPPGVGDNDWTLKIDSGGAPLPGAKVTVFPFQADHGHPTPTVPVVTDNGDGTYTASPVNFSMPGYWDTTITVKTDQTTDKVRFGFCAE